MIYYNTNLKTSFCLHYGNILESAQGRSKWGRVVRKSHQRECNVIVIMCLCVCVCVGNNVINNDFVDG